MVRSSPVRQKTGPCSPVFSTVSKKGHSPDRTGPWPVYHPVTTAPISWDIANFRTESVAASALLIPCLRHRFPHAKFEQSNSLLLAELSSSILVGLLGKTNSLSSRDSVNGTLALALLQKLSGASKFIPCLWFGYEIVDEVFYISIPISSYLSCNVL